MTYAEKLKDVRWQKMRLNILNRDEFTCRHCFIPGKTLHVHHSYYVKGREPWDYPKYSLVSLCEECHGEVEGAIEIGGNESRQTELEHAIDMFLMGPPDFHASPIWEAGILLRELDKQGVRHQEIYFAIFRAMAALWRSGDKLPLSNAPWIPEELQMDYKG